MNKNAMDNVFQILILVAHLAKMYANTLENVQLQVNAVMKFQDTSSVLKLLNARDNAVNMEKLIAGTITTVTQTPMNAAQMLLPTAHG